MISSVFVFVLLFTLAVSYALPLAEQLLSIVLSNLLSVDALIALIIFLASAIGIGHGLYLSLHTFNYARKLVFF